MGPLSLDRLRETVRSSFCLIPAVCALGAIGLALGLEAVDRRIGDTGIAFLLFPGPPEGARSFLSAIIGSMISFTGLVFSITVVVLVLTSGQFSPRVLRGFLRDRTIQWSLGVFVATFLYAMTIIRTVLGTNGVGAYVPRLAVTVAFLLVLLSVGLFVYYIHHMANMIRISSIIARIGEEARRLLEARYPTEPPPVAPEPLACAPGTIVPAPRPGVVVSVNEAAIANRAGREECVVVLVPRVGDFVPAGGPLFTVHGGAAPPDWVCDCVALDSERTMEQDLAFGFRQLVDIAEKALSPSVNDPTTACQTIDALHDLLRRLATRPPPTGYHSDGDGQIRLVVPQYDFADLLAVAVAEIWHYGHSSTQVPERLAVLLRDLRSAVLPEYLPAVAHWEGVVGVDARSGNQPAASTV
ncbi:MAG: DUF2254 domain-containing protein [Pseudonocardiaceae bacterium]